MNVSVGLPDSIIHIAILAPALSMRLGLRALLGESPDISIDLDSASLEDISTYPVEVTVLVIAGRAATIPGLKRLLETHASGAGALLLVDNPIPPGFFSHLERPGGVLSLEASPQELAAAVRAVHAGLWVGDPALLSNQFSPNLHPGEEDEDTGEKLTPRENEVLQQLALGLANKQIANSLGMSENTVKFHISSIYTKLGASNRAEAVRLGARRGLISL